MGTRTLRWLSAAVILLIAVFLAMQVWTLRVGLHRYRGGEGKRALPILKVARILNPFSASIALALADIYLVNGEIEDAEKILEATIARSPKNARAHNLMGVTMQARGRFGEAMKEYDLAIQLDPGFAIAHLNRGYLLLRAAKTEAGMEELDKAVELEPKLAENRDEILRRLSQASIPSPAPFTPK